MIRIKIAELEDEIEALKKEQNKVVSEIHKRKKLIKQLKKIEKGSN